MFFKTYYKSLVVSGLALTLLGFGGSELPIAVENNYFASVVEIISKTDNIEIQDLKLNRGNCEHDKNLLKKLSSVSLTEANKEIREHQAKIASYQTELRQLTQYMQQLNDLDGLFRDIYTIIGQMIDYSGDEYEKFNQIPRKFKLLCLTLDCIAVAYKRSVIGKATIGVGITQVEGDDVDNVSRVYTLGRKWIGIFNNIAKGGYIYTKDDNPIFLVTKILKEMLGSYEYKSADSHSNIETLSNILNSNIKYAIEDTKNPNDYPYINLKELKKLLDSIVNSDGQVADGFFDGDYISKKGIQRLAKLKFMWPSVEKFYLAYLKEAIPRHAKEITDKLIASEKKSIQTKIAKINKMEKIIKDLKSKKNTMAVDLKFGESFTARYNCQNLIEVEVKTDKGAWTFNFNR